MDFELTMHGKQADDVQAIEVLMYSKTLPM